MICREKKRRIVQKKDFQDTKFSGCFKNCAECAKKIVGFKQRNVRNGLKDGLKWMDLRKVYKKD